MLHSLSFLRGGCAYQPTCSEYAQIALAQHGLLRGGALALWRLLRCNPFSRGGWDPRPRRGIHRKSPSKGAPRNIIHRAANSSAGSRLQSRVP